MVDNSAGSDNSFAVVCDACTIAIRVGAIRPFSVISAKMPKHDHDHEGAQIAAPEQDQRA